MSHRDVIAESEIDAGSTITFSSGQNPSSISNLKIRRGDITRMQGLAAEFPDIADRLTGKVPLFANFYPSGFGTLPGFCAIECGMRPANALKAITLAARHRRAFLISGQPLAIGQVASMLDAQPDERSPYALIALGGYESFAELDKMIEKHFLTVFKRVDILHLYGLNEVDFALLAGRREPGGDAHYRAIQDEWTLQLHGDTSAFIQRDSGETVPIEDTINAIDDAFVVRQPQHKISTAVRQFLAVKDEHWWQSHTGYIGMRDQEFQSQLRPGVMPQHDSDWRYGQFIDAFGMAIQEKPRWSFEPAEQ
jgi:hypothetical protein